MYKGLISNKGTNIIQWKNEKSLQNKKGAGTTRYPQTQE